MWWTFDGMSEEFQELVQEDLDNYGRKDTEPMPANENLAEKELVLATESTIDPQPNLRATGSTLFHEFFYNFKRRGGQC